MLRFRLALAALICFTSSDVSLADGLLADGLLADGPNTEPTTSAAAPSTNSLVMPPFHALADKTPLKLAWDAHSREDHQRWREAFHAKMIKLLGRMPESVPFEVKWAERKDFDGFVRHKVYVRSEELYWSPAYYFVPHSRQGKAPAIVCLHGHSGIYPYIGECDEKEQKKTKELSLDYAVYLAEHGYVTIAPVIRGWNETSAFEDARRSCRRVTMDAFLVGTTPMGLRCWDAMRLIDFLQSREEVDSDRIGVAGLSGGGTLAMYLPILDERVKLAMAGGAFSSYRSSIYAVPHCICNCLPHIMEWGEMSDVLALQAPRPLLLINGIKDDIVPIVPAREGYGYLAQVYQLLGAQENLDADFFDGPHAWSNNKTLSFLEKHFGTDK